MGHTSRTYCFYYISRVHRYVTEQPNINIGVQLYFKGPEIVIEQPNINLGLVRLGESVETKLTLRNDSRTMARWGIKESPMHRSTEYAVSYIFVHTL